MALFALPWFFDQLNPSDSQASHTWTILPAQTPTLSFSQSHPTDVSHCHYSSLLKYYYSFYYCSYHNTHKRHIRKRLFTHNNNKNNNKITCRINSNINQCSLFHKKNGALTLEITQSGVSSLEKKGYVHIYFWGKNTSISR